MKKIYPYLVAFASGYVIMALELVGFRIFAPYFGNTIYVWGSLIGMVLLSLSAGYYLGGYLSEKYPFWKPVYMLLVIAIGYLVPINIFYPSILGFLNRGGIVIGSLIATFVLFGPPLILVSALAPLMIKLTAKDGVVGLSVGKIYTISTIGSLVGTFLTSFWLVPSFGSFKAFIVTNTFLFLILILGLFFSKKKYLLLFPFFLPLYLIDTNSYLSRGFESTSGKFPGDKLVYIAESPYNLVYISKFNDAYTLHLNQWGRHSYYVKGGVEYSLESVSYREFLRLFPELNKASTILILGLGGGTSMREYLKVNPFAKIDAVEIDPKVIEASKIFFNLEESGNVKIFEEDARPFLHRKSGKYDFIEIDTYQGNYYIPFYLATFEFFKILNEKLTEKGIFAMNVVSQKSEGKKDYVADAIENTMKRVFPSVFSLKFAANKILFGWKEIAPTCFSWL